MEGEGYTIDEIIKNNGENGNKLWILIDGKVYDVTDYKHPGGREFLEDNVGEDRFQEFEAQGHSNAAKNDLKKLYIGYIKEDPNKPSIPRVSSSTASLKRNPSYPGLFFPILILIVLVLVFYKLYY